MAFPPAGMAVDERDRMMTRDKVDYLWPTQRHLALSLWCWQHFFVLRLIGDSGGTDTWENFLGLISVSPMTAPLFGLTTFLLCDQIFSIFSGSTKLPWDFSPFRKITSSEYFMKSCSSCFEEIVPSKWRTLFVLYCSWRNQGSWVIRWQTFSQPLAPEETAFLSSAEGRISRLLESTVCVLVGCCKEMYPWREPSCPQASLYPLGQCQSSLFWEVIAGVVPCEEMVAFWQGHPGVKTHSICQVCLELLEV